MQTEIKAWLETTTMKVAEDRFLKPPALPYIVFADSVDVSGADNINNVTSRNISVEMYSATIDRNSEQKVEDLLNTKGISYTKYRTWLGTEMFFQTVYDFNLIEKI